MCIFAFSAALRTGLYFKRLFYLQIPQMLVLRFVLVFLKSSYLIPFYWLIRFYISSPCNCQIVSHINIVPGHMAKYKLRTLTFQARAAPWLEVNPGSHEGGPAASGKPQAASAEKI